MAGVGARLRSGTGARTVGGLLCVAALSVAIAACGSSTKKSSTHSTAAAATTTSPTTYQNTLSTSTAAKHPAHHAKAVHKAHPATTTTSSGGVSPSPTSSTTHKSSSRTHTATASSSHASGSSAAKKTTNSPPPPKPAAPKPAALPAPVVSATSGGLHASFHGQDHNPRAGQNWNYSVLATDASGNALSGTVETEFAFNGTVVGRESPATHPLKNGRLDDILTFPARAVGFPLSVQVVVHTSAGSVTLDWPVKTRR